MPHSAERESGGVVHGGGGGGGGGAAAVPAVVPLRTSTLTEQVPTDRTRPHPRSAGSHSHECEGHACADHAAVPASKSLSAIPPADEAADLVGGVSTYSTDDDGPRGPGPMQLVSPSTYRRGCGTKDHHRIWYSWDICGMVCSAIVWFVDFTSLWGMTVVVYRPWLGGSLWFYPAFAMQVLLIILGLTCHIRAMFSNPGAVPRNARPLNPAHWDRTCHKCNHFKPIRAHHCSICKRCIVKMDHHCPWIASCVGVGNMKFFILFVVYIFSTSAYCLLMLAARFLTCMSPTATCDPDPALMMGFIALVATGCLFGLFTGCLLFDQIGNILSNTTNIDRMKGLDHTDPLRDELDDRLMVWHNLSEVFGGDPAREGWRWTWLIPTSVTLKDPEAVAGFCFRDVPRLRTAAEMEMV